MLLNKLGIKQSGNEIWPVYVILQNEKLFSKNSMKNVAWKLVSCLLFLKNPLQKGI